MIKKNWLGLKITLALLGVFSITNPAEAITFKFSSIEGIFGEGWSVHGRFSYDETDERIMRRERVNFSDLTDVRYTLKSPFGSATVPISDFNNRAFQFETTTQRLAVGFLSPPNPSRILGQRDGSGRNRITRRIVAATNFEGFGGNIGYRLLFEEDGPRTPVNESERYNTDISFPDTDLSNAAIRQLNWEAGAKVFQVAQEVPESGNILGLGIIGAGLFLSKRVFPRRKNSTIKL